MDVITHAKHPQRTRAYQAKRLLGLTQLSNRFLDPPRIGQLHRHATQHFNRFVRPTLLDRRPRASGLLDHPKELPRRQTVRIESPQALRERIGLVKPPFVQRGLGLFAQGRSHLCIQLTNPMIAASVAARPYQLGDSAIQILARQRRIDKLSCGLKHSDMRAVSAGSVRLDDFALDRIPQGDGVVEVAAKRLRLRAIRQRLGRPAAAQVRSCPLDQLLHERGHQRLPAAMIAKPLVGLDEPIRLIQPSVGHRYFGLSKLQE
jgi:hypothetical protein